MEMYLFNLDKTNAQDHAFKDGKYKFICYSLLSILQYEGG